MGYLVFTVAMFVCLLVLLLVCVLVVNGVVVCDGTFYFGFDLLILVCVYV